MFEFTKSLMANTRLQKKYYCFLRLAIFHSELPKKSVNCRRRRKTDEIIFCLPFKLFCVLRCIEIFIPFLFFY